MEKEFYKCESGQSAGKSTLVVIAILIVELYFASPVIMFYRYYKGNLNLKYLPTIQICANLLNCSQYILSGCKDLNIQKIVCNSIGILISIILVVFIWVVYSKRQFTEYLIALFMIFNIIFQIFYFLSKNPNLNYLLSIIFNVIMYGATMQNIYWVIIFKNAELLPIASCVLGLIASILWTVFGKICEDDQTFIPNVISIGILAIPIIIYVILKVFFKEESNRTTNEYQKNLVSRVTTH